MAWITPSRRPEKMFIKFQLEVQLCGAKPSIKMRPTPYNLARSPTVSSIYHLMRRITHHHEQKGSVACPMFPPIAQAQWAQQPQLINVLEVCVSVTMIDET